MKHIITVIIIVLIPTLFSCEKNENKITPDKNDQSTIEVKNGILVFNNSNTLASTLKEIEEMTPDEYMVWMQKNNFVSLQSIYNEILKAEEKVDESNQNLYEAEMIKTAPPVQHSELYFKYLDMGLIRKVIDKENQLDSYELNTSFPAFAPILSPQGIYMVGDTIIYCGSDTLKYWIHGDINNLEKLISTSEVSPDFEIWTAQNTLKSTFSPNPRKSPYGMHGSDDRIYIWYYFTTWQYLGNGTVWKYSHYINVKSESKNWLGTWKYSATDMYIKGSWEGNLKYENPVYLNTLYYYFSAVFHPSYYPGYYHNWAKDLYCSISLFDGTISPYPTEWQVSYAVGGQNAKILDLSISTTSWEVIGHIDAVARLQF
jgi:hypothetical protein